VNCHAIERHNESIIHKSGERRVLAALEGGSSHAVPQQPGPPSPLDGSQPIDNETSTSQGIESGENSPHSTAAPISHILVHTGQHYDERMSKSFFDALDIPRPDIDLEVGSGTHAEQVGNTMIAFEKVLQEHRPDWVVVVGDVNATCACSITAKKEGIKVAHIEAGLRSFDMAMPEEINRLVTDRLSDLLLTPDRLSSENLRKEGVPEDRIAFVGNIMIDTLEAHREAASKLEIDTIIKTNALDPTLSAFQHFSVSAFSLMTMHRPSNVDRQEVLEPILGFLLDEVCTNIHAVDLADSSTGAEATADIRALEKGDANPEPISAASAGLSRDAAPEHGCCHHADRLRWPPGGMLRTRHPLPHPALEHGTPHNPARAWWRQRFGGQ